jgi:hypothetical protein
MANGAEALDTEIEVTDDIAARVEEMNRTGEMELSIDKPEEETEEVEASTDEETKPEEKDEPAKANFTFKGREYTQEELEQALEVSENPRKFLAQATQKSQEVSKEKERLEAEKSKIEVAIKAAKDSSMSDPALDKMVEAMESIHGELEATKARLAQREAAEEQWKKAEEYRTAKEQVMKYWEDAKEKFPDVDIPKPGTKEFDKFLAVAKASNPVELAAFKLYRDQITSTKEKKPPMKTLDSRPDSGNGKGLNNDQRAFNAKMNPGMSQAMLDSIAAQMG